MNKSIKKQKIKSLDVENIKRDSFTPNWSKSISKIETLPIKRNGKVIRITKESIDKDGVEERIIDSDDDNDNDKTKKNEKHNQHLKTKDKTKSIEKKSKTLNTDVSFVFIKKNPIEMQLLQQKVADICSSIIANPEKSLKKKSTIGGTSNHSYEDDRNDILYRMTDLFDMLASNDAQIFELTMLSALVVFKDICPGYRIRSIEEYDKDVQLKKDTKQMKDFELSLLGAYQKYLKILENKIQLGLNINPKKEILNWNDINTKIGLSALRCQCELLRSLSHFNFCSSLVGHVVTRSIQPDEQISKLCCDTITNLLMNDHLSELSYEIVKSIAKVLALCKYIPTSENIIKCLYYVKLSVHADDSKDIHRKAKTQRKKRKHNTDEVELGYLEANTEHDKTSKLRYQADCLHEISLIYFRIVKMKVGYSLIPIALEGLSRITHLINIDMVQDLMTLLKNILEQNAPSAPVLIQLQCVHCALKTLSGPGQELNLDSDVYLYKLKSILSDLPSNFMDWNVLLDCLDICFLKKREERMNIVSCFARLIILIAIHISDSHAPVLYAMVHTILTRYPKVRYELLLSKPSRSIHTNISTASTSLDQNNDIKSNPKYAYIANKASGLFIEDDTVNDLAMKALREESFEDTHSLLNVNWDMNDSKLDDLISWILPLQRLHIDQRYNKLIDILSSKDLLPIPLRINDTKINKTNFIINRLTESINFLPKTLKVLSKIPEKSTMDKSNINNKSKIIKSNNKMNYKSNRKKK